MWSKEASKAQVNTSSSTTYSGTRQDNRKICKYCGSFLDSDGAHTDEWLRSWMRSNVRKRSRIYRVWGAMRERCNNPNQSRFATYGGRGITVCSDWDDFAVFRQWMLEQGYRPGLQIDRIDNDDGYYPANCRLCTRTEQMQNRRLPSRHRTGKRYARRFLTEDDVYAIRKSELSYSALARIYDIHNTHARNIKLGMAWRHLPERAPTDHLSELGETKSLNMASLPRPYQISKNDHDCILEKP